MPDYIPITEERLKIACPVCCGEGWHGLEHPLICGLCKGLGYTIETVEQYLERTRDARSEWKRN